MRVERGEHAVDGGVLDLTLILVLGDEVVLDEGEDVPHLERDLPDVVDVAVVELAGGVADGDPDLAFGKVRVRVAAIGRGRGGDARLLVRALLRATLAAELHHHLGDLPLDGFEARGEHLLRVDAARVDVVVLDLDDRLAQRLEAGEVVVLVRFRVDGGVRVGGPQGVRRSVARDAGEGKQERCGKQDEPNGGLRSHVA